MQLNVPGDNALEFLWEAGGHVHAAYGQLGSDFSVESRLHGPIELIDDCAGSLCWRGQTYPGGDAQVSKVGLDHCWRVAQYGRALRTHHTQRVQLARFDVGNSFWYLGNIASTLPARVSLIAGAGTCYFKKVVPLDTFWTLP